VNKESYRFYYGWVILAVSFLTLFLALGFRFSFGVFYVAILGEYGWGRGETAAAFSLAMLINALFAPVSGTLIDRFSPRKLFPLGAIFLVIGLVAASRITTIWHLYLFFGVVMAIGINTIGFGPHAALIPKWFIRRRGLASGIVLSGMGLGIMVIAPLSEFMIDTVGWRSAFLILAGGTLGLVVPATALFQRRSPEEVGQYPDGIDSGSNEVRAPQSSHLPEQWTFKAAIGTKAFWWMALAPFSNGFVTNTLVVHQAAHMVDSGYSQILAASLVGLVGLLMAVGGIFFGFLSDRVGREMGFTLGSGASFVGILLFLLVRDTSSPWMVYTFAILYGLGHGALGPTSISALGDLFPGPSLGRIMAILSIQFGIGGALGPYFAGYFFDQKGSYFVPFLLLLFIIGLGVLGIWMAAPRRRRPIYQAVEP
jgi:MFS family permease